MPDPKLCAAIPEVVIVCVEVGWTEESIDRGPSAVEHHAVQDMVRNFNAHPDMVSYLGKGAFYANFFSIAALNLLTYLPMSAWLANCLVSFCWCHGLYMITSRQEHWFFGRVIPNAQHYKS